MACGHQRTQVHPGVLRILCLYNISHIRPLLLITNARPESTTNDLPPAGCRRDLKTTTILAFFARRHRKRLTSCMTGERGTFICVKIHHITKLANLV